MPTSTSQSSPLTVQKLWKRLGWLRFFLPVLLLLLVRGITGSNLFDGTKQSQQETITQAVARKTIPITVTANGTVDAERSINLSPKASGVIKTLLVKESDRVRQGQIIAVMDDATLRGDLTQYRGQLAQQEANLNKVLNGNRPEDIAQAQAKLNQIQAKLRQSEDDLQRNQGLFKESAISQQELESAASVAVIAPTVQKNLFPININPIGQKIRIQGEIYDVVGVMEAKGSKGPQDRDDAVYIPLTSMSARIIGNNSLMGISINGIYLKDRDETQLKVVQFQATNILRLRHNIYPPDEDDFNITNQADILQTFTTILNLLTIMIVGIAGISLVVGGIGIANIMLSVVERTREIGIRKALGAPNSAVLSQFLTESVVISVMGGGITFIAASLFKFPFIVSISAVVTGFVLSTSVGLIAGVIPARNAAKLDPIAALRSE